MYIFIRTCTPITKNSLSFMSTFPGYAEKGKQLWKMVPVVLFGSMTVPYCFSTYQEKLF